ncbi:MAG: hypothetical protein BAJATHORv1_20621 [Candidatus Thorarchaeota archaeon]|nr:MAG: hypothetical protein BAJATHORv1_20621 [Candidatus Thorarchaeota archaeon]
MIRMSLLGPDDFDLSEKERKKKLAKDLSPELRKYIDKWLDEMSEQQVIEKVSEIMGSREAATAAVRKIQMRHEKKDIH